MSANASTNDSLLHPNLPSILSHLPFGIKCLITRPSSFIFTTFCITGIVLLLPLCILILHVGLRRWRQQRSTSTAAATSHSDSFAYHMVAMELIGVSGLTVCCCGVYMDNVNLFSVGLYLYRFTWHGEMLFHLPTCVERYLAVVHPITYLSLRSERGIRIRNVTIGCIWVLCFGGTSVLLLENVSIITDCCIMIFFLIVTSFCSLSVLCVLIRPGPGEQGGDRERVDQSKQRAFYTIVAILGVLLLRFFWSMIWLVLNMSRGSDCVVMTVGIWFNLPSSLVLPLLFLHRAGTLACCKR